MKRMSSIKIKSNRDFKSLFDEFFSNFKTLSFKNQVIIFFLILMMLFLVIILVLKFLIITLELDSHINTDIQQQVVNTFLNNQNEYLKKFNLQNSIDYTSSYYEDLTFLKVLNLETEGKLGSISSLKKTSLSKFNNGGPSILKGYTDMKFEMLIPSNTDKITTLESYLSNKNAVFMNYLFDIIPLFFHFDVAKGIKVNSYYYLTTDLECSEANTFFFKYPIHILDYSANDNNFEVHDSITDPVTSCTIDRLSMNTNSDDESKAESEKELVINNNWFYHIHQKYLSLLKEAQTSTNAGETVNTESSINPNNIKINKILKFVKIGLNLYREEFSFNFQLYTNDNKLVLIVAKYDLQDDFYPFMNNIYSDSEDLDYYNQEVFSVYNYITTQIYVPLFRNITDDIYYNEYNIDDSYNQLIRIPTFLEDLFRYTFFPNNIDPNIDAYNTEDTSKNTALPDINTLLLDNKIMTDIKNKRFSINSYFTKDTNFYSLVAFFNNLLTFKKIYEVEYETKTDAIPKTNIKYVDKSKYEFINKTDTTASSPCYYSNLTEYYDNIKDLVDCKKQICSIIDCSKRNDIYINFYSNPASYSNLANCYCMPLLCYDNQTIVDAIPDDFKDIYQILTSYSNAENPLSEYTYRELNDECRMTFYKKHSIHTKFNYRLSLSSYHNIYYDSLQSFIYLSAEINEEYVMKIAKGTIDDIIYIISCSYSLLVLIVLLIFLREIILSIDNFKERIDSTSNIHRKILANSSIEMSKHEEIEEEEDYVVEDNNDIENIDEKIALDNNSKKEVKAFSKEGKSQYDITNNNIKNINEHSERTKNFDNMSNHSDLVINNNIQNPDISNSIISPNDYNTKDRFKDELQELLYIINDNMKDFTMDFDINKNIYLEYPIIQKYSNYLRKKIYSYSIMPNKKDIFALKRKKKCEERSFIKEESKEYSESESQDSESSYSDQNSEGSDTDKKIIFNLSINILSELLSCEYIDIGDYNKNFFFRQNHQNSLFNFYDYINSFLINDETYVNEITDPEKLSTALRYINNEIINKWFEVYLLDKDIDDF